VSAPIPIAVLGTGFGARIQVPGLRASRRFVVTALVGRRPERVRRIAERLGVPHALTSFGEALALPEIAAVSIATPPGTHAEYAIAAVRAGKHVLCEKPMARTVAEADAMQEATRAAGVVGLIDHEFRFEPGRAALGRLLARGELGAPRLVTAVANIPLFADAEQPAPAWWFDAAAGGGWIGASGSHLIDALRLWLGEFAAVAALTDTFGRGDAEDAFSLLFRTVSGAQGVMQQTSVAWGPPYLALRVAGSEATAWIDEDGRLWRAGRDGAAAVVEVPVDLRLPPVAAPPEAGPFAARELPAFVRQAERFADAIERPGTAHDPPAATFEDGVACQQVMDAARASARHGRWVGVARP
jgi:predicted dehydrogenase